MLALDKQVETHGTMTDHDVDKLIAYDKRSHQSKSKGDFSDDKWQQSAFDT